MASNKYNDRLLELGYTQEQIDSMVSGVNSGQSANDVVQNNTPSTPITPSSSSSSSSSNSGGNYVYNESTGYYEQQTPSSSSSNSGSYTYNPTSGYYEQQSTPSGRSSQQTTQTQNTQQPKQQTQTAGNTVVENQQQGVMKPLSQEYYNQTSDNALNTIRDNLNNYRQTNPEYFTDYDTFKRFQLGF